MTKTFLGLDNSTVISGFPLLPVALKSGPTAVAKEKAKEMRSQNRDVMRRNNVYHHPGT